MVHHKNSKLYDSLRLRIAKTHRGITIVEKPWLKSYIEKKNTKLRMEAKNDFKKDFFKLVNNSVFGKTMENIRKRVDVRLVNKLQKSSKAGSKTQLQTFDHI